MLIKIDKSKKALKRRDRLQESKIKIKKIGKSN